MGEDSIECSEFYDTIYGVDKSDTIYIIADDYSILGGAGYY